MIKGTSDKAEPLNVKGVTSKAVPFVPVKRFGGLLFCSGHGPLRSGEAVFTGAVGRERTIEEGREAAKLCVLGILESLEQALGSLDEIEEIISLRGFVNSDPSFTQQSQVMNAASELLLNKLGNKGMHVRSAIGVTSLPRGFTVEIELIAVAKPCTSAQVDSQLPVPTAKR